MAQAYPDDPPSDDFKCGVCKDVFENPKFLPCHHTFCENCIVGLTRTSEYGLLLCPICRKQTILLEQDVSMLQKNFYIPNWLRDDTLVCQSHRNERFRFLCLTCDSKALCCECLFPGHSGHDVHNFDKAISEARCMLKALESQLKNRIDEQSRELIQLRKTKDKAQRKHGILRAEFIRRAVTLKKKIDSALEEALKDLDDCMKPLTETEQLMQDKLERGQEVERTLNEALAGANKLLMVQISHDQTIINQTEQMARVVRQPEQTETVQEFDESQSRLNQVTFFLGRVRVRFLATKNTPKTP